MSELPTVHAQREKDDVLLAAIYHQIAYLHEEIASIRYRQDETYRYMLILRVVEAMRTFLDKHRQRPLVRVVNRMRMRNRRFVREVEAAQLQRRRAGAAL